MVVTTVTAVWSTAFGCESPVPGVLVTEEMGAGVFGAVDDGSGCSGGGIVDSFSLETSEPALALGIDKLGGPEATPLKAGDISIAL